MQMNTDLSSMPLYGWVLLAAILFPQGVLLFRDAGKRNANPWFWGIWGLIQFPCPTLFYLILVRKVFKRKNN